MLCKRSDTAYGILHTTLIQGDELSYFVEIYGTMNFSNSSKAMIYCMTCRYNLECIES